MSLANLRFMVQMAEYDDSVNIVQAPQILVLDNEEASVFIGNVRTYALIQQTVDEGDASYSFEEREILVGVQLLVIPHVCRGTDQVILEIIPKQTDDPVMTEVSIGGNSIQIPSTMRVKTVHTKMMLHSTETGVIAGLFRDEQTEQIRKVPGLHKIPVIGNAFKHSSKGTVKQNTMILVTPTIIPPKHSEEFDRDIEDFRESLASSLK
jgi:type II secretory pathway component GspD/PulD (secretin)